MPTTALDLRSLTLPLPVAPTMFWCITHPETPQLTFPGGHALRRLITFGLTVIFGVRRRS